MAKFILVHSGDKEFRINMDMVRSYYDHTIIFFDSDGRNLHVEETAEEIDRKLKEE